MIPRHGNKSFRLRSISNLRPFSYSGAVVPAIAEESQGIASANIVGFQNVSVTNGFSFFTVTFKNVGATTTDYVYDLMDVKVLQANGAEWPATPAGCVNNLTVQKIAANGAYGTKYAYNSTKSSGVVKGWTVFGGASISRGEVKLEKGEGLIVYFDKKNSGVPVPTCILQLSGEVELSDNSTFLRQGFSFSGNNTPVTVDLTDIRVLQANGEEWPATPAGCVNNLTVQKITADGAYGTKYAYNSTKSSGVVKGWINFSTGVSLVKGDVTFEPGEGFIAYFDKKVSGVPVEFCKIVLPSPIKE